MLLGGIEGAALRAARGADGPAEARSGTKKAVDFVQLLCDVRRELFAVNDRRTNWTVKRVIPLSKCPINPDAAPEDDERLDYEEARTAAEPQVWQVGARPKGCRGCNFPIPYLEACDTCSVTCLLAIRLFRAFRSEGRAVLVSSRSLGVCEVEGVRLVRGRYIAPTGTVVNPLIYSDLCKSVWTVLTRPVRVVGGAKEYGHEWLRLSLRCTKPPTAGAGAVAVAPLMELDVDPSARQYGVAKEVLVWHEGNPEPGAQHRVNKVLDPSDSRLNSMVLEHEAANAAFMGGGDFARFL